jgi:hypothetical protein
MEIKSIYEKDEKLPKLQLGVRKFERIFTSPTETIPIVNLGLNDGILLSGLSE